MNLSAQYRSTEGQQETLRILQKASISGNNFLWQSFSNSKNIIPIHHFEIDFVSREVVVYLSREPSQIDKDVPIYIKLHHKSTVFKVCDYTLTQNSLQFAFPQEMKALEYRSLDRVRVSPECQVTASFFSSIYDDQMTRAVVALVRDVSPMGVGFSLPSPDLSFLKRHRFILISEIADQKLSKPILGEVIYSKAEDRPEFQNKKVKNIRIGVKLSTPIPDNVLKIFLN